MLQAPKDPVRFIGSNAYMLHYAVVTTRGRKRGKSKPEGQKLCKLSEMHQKVASFKARNELSLVEYLVPRSVLVPTTSGYLISTKLDILEPKMLLGGICGGFSSG